MQREGVMERVKEKESDSKSERWRERARREHGATHPVLHKLFWEQKCTKSARDQTNKPCGVLRRLWASGLQLHTFVTYVTIPRPECKLAQWMQLRERQRLGCSYTKSVGLSERRWEQVPVRSIRGSITITVTA
ncbi:unnamed protein product [Arctogadus glacialis]